MTTLDHHGATALPTAGEHHGHSHGSFLTPKVSIFAAIWDWATTVDHKKIGLMYLFAVLFFFFLGGIAALAVRLELFYPVRTVTDAAGITHLTGQLFGAADATATAKGN